VICSAKPYLPTSIMTMTPATLLSAQASASAQPASTSAADFGRVQRIAWGVLGWNVLVVLWGAVVRATGSGAGCGSHWPRCNGETLPQLASIATKIEFSHRLTSGLALLSVVWLLIEAWRLVGRTKVTGSVPVLATEKATEKGADRLASNVQSALIYDAKRVRRYAALTMVFMLGEAGLGAALVLFEHVAHNASLKRALSMSLHLTNTFLLLSALVATAVAARFPTEPLFVRSRRTLAGLTFFLLFPIGVTGAIAALGDTLFPATSLLSGLTQDLSPSAHVLLRLRTMHPFVAVGCATGIFWLAGALGIGRARAPANIVRALVVAQVCLGLINLLALAPIVLQLTHLLLADCLLIATVYLAAIAPAKSVEIASPDRP
jgi:heme a synthase